MTKGNQTDVFETHLDEQWPVESWKNLSVIVAVSGGPDSVALLRGLNSLRLAETHPLGRFEVAHFNHGWRAEAAEEDEQFVYSLCESFNLELHVGKAVSAVQTEEVARNERHDFLRNIAEQRGARYIAFAHTANDQAETILHRIIRGTGLKGLRGIPARRQLSEAVTLVRPLLGATHDDVLAYLGRLRQSYRTDSSNADLRFTRNRIRTELLPQLAQEYNSGIVDSLLRLGKLASEAHRTVHRQVTEMLDSCILRKEADIIELDRQQLIACEPYVAREILAAVWRTMAWPEQAMSFQRWMQLEAAIRQCQTISVPGPVRIASDKRTIRLEGPTTNSE